MDLGTALGVDNDSDFAVPVPSNAVLATNKSPTRTSPKDRNDASSINRITGVGTFAGTPLNMQGMSHSKRGHNRCVSHDLALPIPTHRFLG